MVKHSLKSKLKYEKSKWLRSNPVTAARHFHYRLNTFFQNFLKSCANPLGKLTDYAIRIEFQARGSPHAHTLLWIEGAPKYGIDDDQVVCDFIEFVLFELDEIMRQKDDATFAHSVQRIFFDYLIFSF